VAVASHNSVLVAMFDTLNAVRRTVVWGRLRMTGERPPADHHSFAEHDLLVRSIADRDIGSAEAAMRAHLRSVEQKLMGLRLAAE
jgi:DNA-binding FadR family transcriptional regulator